MINIKVSFFLAYIPFRCRSIVYKSDGIVTPSMTDIPTTEEKIDDAIPPDIIPETIDPAAQ